MVKKKAYKFKEKVWLWGYDTDAPWHFISVPKNETSKIKEDFGKFARGWRSLRIEAKIGKTVWRTSIFLDSRTESYLLPLKASVRKSEEIIAGDTVSLLIKILM